MIPQYVTECKRCNSPNGRFSKGYCMKCYHALRNNRHTKEDKLKERNYIRDGVGILTGVRGEEWIVDLDIFENVKGLLWVKISIGYAVTNNCNGKGILLHKLILPQYTIVDHIDRNPYNNLKNNLRNGENGENGENGINGLNKTLSNKTFSRERGIHKMRNKWQVRIRSRNNRIYLGTFATIKEAKNTLVKYAKEHNLSEFYK